MRDAVVAREVRVAVCVRVECRSGAVAEHARRFLVLEDDHDDMVERRHRRSGGCGPAGEQRADKQPARDRLHDDSMRRRNRWIPTNTSTTVMPIAIPPYAP